MNKKILVVEDHPDIQYILSEVIEDIYGEIKVEHALDGEHALKILGKDKDFYLIFMDIMMPGINGIEIAKGIRQNKDLKEIPLVFFTATTDPKMLSQAKELGDEVIIKPFDIEDIRKILKRYIGGDQK